MHGVKGEFPVGFQGEFQGEFPDEFPNEKILTVALEIFREKTAAKHSIEKPVLSWFCLPYAVQHCYHFEM